MRLVLVFLLLLLAVSVLARRLFWLQLIQGDALEQPTRSRNGSL